MKRLFLFSSTQIRFQHERTISAPLIFRTVIAADVQSAFRSDASFIPNYGPVRFLTSRAAEGMDATDVSEYALLQDEISHSLHVIRLRQVTIHGYETEHVTSGHRTILPESSAFVWIWQIAWMHSQYARTVPVSKLSLVKLAGEQHRGMLTRHQVVHCFYSHGMLFCHRSCFVQGVCNLLL